jgi:hypothetical protein
MGRPTQEELKTALKHAADLREQGEDTFFLAKSLLNLNYRIKILETVLAKANLYLHSGEGAHEHAELVKAIEQAEKASLAAGQEDDDINPW